MEDTVDLGVEGLSPAIYVGAGGSANVFAARLTDTGEQVAVKLLRASADSEKERERFEREHETLSLLSTHEGIVHVVDAGVTDRNEPYFLMPLMEGSLQDRIDNDGALQWEKATQLMAEVADTIEFAHQHKILHRDLKPGNILLDTVGVPRVADFGIAKLLDSNVSKSSKALGTPSFMPPERFKAVEATEASDVYGLGATLAALLTGTAPFLTGENDTDAAVMMRVISEEPPPLSAAGIPAPIADVVTMSMAKNPFDRPASAAEFANLLRNATVDAGGAATAGPVTVAIPRRDLTIPDFTPVTAITGKEEKSKRPLMLLAAAGVFLLTLLGVGGALALTQGDEDPAVVVMGDTQDTESADADSTDADAGNDGANNSGGGDAGDSAGNEGEDGGTVEPGLPANESTAQAKTISGGDTDGDTSTSGTNGTTGTDETTTSTNQPTTGTNKVIVTEIVTKTEGGNTTGAPVDKPGPPAVTETTTTTTTKAPTPKPESCFSVTKSSVEVDDSVSFNNCSADATTYSWNFGDGTSSTLRNPNKSWHTAGTKTVTLTATGAGGTDTHTTQITVTTQPPPPVTPTACFSTSDHSVETGTSVSFSNCSKDAASYAWDFGDGGTSTQMNPTHSYTSAGSKTVRLTATGPGGTHSTTRSITVTAPPVKPTACFSASDYDPVVNNDSVSFSNCSTHATSYHWNFGDGESSTSQSPSHTYNRVATFTVTLTVKGTGGEDSATRTITVKNQDRLVNDPPQAENIACQNISATQERWSWDVYGRVNDYIMVLSNGTRVSMGRTSGYTTGNGTLKAIISDRDGLETTRNIGASSSYGCTGWVEPTVPAPAGVSCSFSNFQANDENTNWKSWTSHWKWNVHGDADSYIVVHDTTGKRVNVGKSGSYTATNVKGFRDGSQIQMIIAVKDGKESQPRRLTSCGSEGGGPTWKNFSS